MYIHGMLYAQRVENRIHYGRFIVSHHLPICETKLYPRFSSPNYLPIISRCIGSQINSLSLSIYIHIYICILYIYTCIHTYIYIDIHIYIDICIYIYIICILIWIIRTSQFSLKSGEAGGAWRWPRPTTAEASPRHSENHEKCIEMVRMNGACSSLWLF